MKIVKRLLAGVALLLLLALGAVLALARSAKLPGSEKVPAGMRRNESVYVTMRDGVRIAIDIWYPRTLAPGQRAPTLFNATRYVRATTPALLGRAMMAIGKWPAGGDEQLQALTDAGYVVIRVDARGSGASFGTRRSEWSHDEVRDFGELADWVARQPWSNGRVGAWGVSYEGNTAEMFATTGSSAVKAVAPLYDDFDPSLNLVMPGGVLTAGFMRDWGTMTTAMDRNDWCTVAGATGMKCTLQRLVFAGTKPVDADASGALLDSAVAGHASNYDVYGDVMTLAFPRDVMPSLREPMASVSPFTHRAELERYAVPMLVRVGWLDAGTMNVALGRFFTVNTPQRLEIGPWSHGGGHHVDPFLPESTTTVPTRLEQHAQMLGFFDSQLKLPTPLPVAKEIRYYTMNEGSWHRTTQWPPEGITPVRWYVAAGNALSRTPSTQAGEDRYLVDTTHTTGSHTRWHTQLGGYDVVYPDRAAEDRKILTYTSEPVSRDVEITGVPVLSLAMASTHDDASVHAYLEDVAPDGRVTYVTEGIFRAINRKVSTEPPPYRVFGPYHSYRREDAMPLVPGEVADLGFELFATSVVIKAGHRIRLALAGTDRSMFNPIPPGATPTWRVIHGGANGTYLELPMRDR